MEAPKRKSGPRDNHPDYGLYAESRKAPGTWVLSEISRDTGISVKTLRLLIRQHQIAVPRKIKGWGGIPQGMVPFIRGFYQLTDDQYAKLLKVWADREAEKLMRRWRRPPPSITPIEPWIIRDSQTASKRSTLAKHSRKCRPRRRSPRSRPRASWSSRGPSTTSNPSRWRVNGRAIPSTPPPHGDPQRC